MHGTVLTVGFCHQAYALFILVGCTASIIAGIFTTAVLYGLGGVELMLALTFVGLFGLVRLLFPPWSIYLDDDSSYFTRQRQSRTLKDLDVSTFVIKLSDDRIVTSWSACPICLEEYDRGDKVSTSQVCQHTCHSQCLQMWVSKSPTCPYCRQDLEKRRCAPENRKWGGAMGFIESFFS